jgi:hypothetical protein
MLACLLNLSSAAMSQTALCLFSFSFSRVFFVGATSLVPQQQFLQFLHVLHTQPSRRTF